MMTLFHAPQSRSSAIVSLIDELGAGVKVQEVTVKRQDGSGAPDPSNPHPEKKVPYLVDGDEMIRERGAIILYLTDKFPAAGLAPVEGETGRGAYLSWLFYYQGIMEPLLLLQWAGLSHPALQSSLGEFDTMIAKLAAALEKQPFLLGDTYSAADLLCSGPFLWLPDFLPDNEAIRSWVKRCAERPSVARVMAREFTAA